MAKLLERDLEEAIEAALHRGDLTEIKRQGPAKLKTWPRVGRVDVVATGADGQAAFELDEEHAYQSAFRVAGATTAVWELDDQHTRVYDDGRHKVERLYQASVAGERDNIGFGAIVTRACQACRSLVEVPAETTPEQDLCPKCGSPGLCEWSRRGSGWDPCPTCGGLIRAFDRGIRN